MANSALQNMESIAGLGGGLINARRALEEEELQINQHISKKAKILAENMMEKGREEERKILYNSLMKGIKEAAIETKSSCEFNYKTDPYKICFSSAEYPKDNPKYCLKHKNAVYQRRYREKN